jgi:hypothetical protein
MAQGILVRMRKTVVAVGFSNANVSGEQVILFRRMKYELPPLSAIDEVASCCQCQKDSI